MTVETLSISADEDGIRLDRWFRRHYPKLTHGRLEKLLRTGQIRLDGKRARASDRIAAGAALRLPPNLNEVRVEDGREAREARPADEKFLQGLVLHMDGSVIVLNKPAGLATQGGSGIKRHIDGMLDALAYGKKQRPRLVHRLDRDTSGVLVVARTVPAAAKLAKSLAQRDAAKIYWALTKGAPQRNSGTIKAALLKEGGHGPRGTDERMAVVAHNTEDAKYSLTDYQVMERVGDAFAWVAAKPLTGRTHQIRVHLQSLGTPIVGDFKYGAPELDVQGLENKLHLHAREIDIAHPDGGRLTVTAPLPPHMLKAWKFLGFDPNAKTPPFQFKKKK
jgi:23S rRNA pseudouridine955/2504/2580 synthase